MQRKIFGTTGNKGGLTRGGFGGLGSGGGSPSIPPFTDNGNRADGPIGNGWVANPTNFFRDPSPSIVIASNKFSAVVGAQFYSVVRPEIIADGRVAIKLDSIAGGAGGIALIARVSADGANGYAFFYEPGYRGIAKITNNVFASLISTGFSRAPSAGDALEFSPIGTNLTAKVTYALDGVIETINTTDAAFASGKWGFGFDNMDGTVDDFTLQVL